MVKTMVVRAAVVALLAGGGITVTTLPATADDNAGAPTGSIAPIYQGKAPWGLDWEGADRSQNDGTPGGGIAPAEHDWGLVPPGESDGAPGGGFAPAYDDAIINLTSASTDGDGDQDYASAENGGSPGGG
ncbi:hypothetical protein ACIBKX_36990 [Streptomyces sp. NPDC050658]|uniref:hypothetical protein n=1 Tax=unclassified Streptomyces TaxID=2593676 RepID=UPI00343146C5